MSSILAKNINLNCFEILKYSVEVLTQTAEKLNKKLLGKDLLIDQIKKLTIWD